MTRPASSRPGGCSTSRTRPSTPTIGRRPGTPWTATSRNSPRARRSRSCASGARCCATSVASRDPFALRVEAGLRGRGLTLRGFCRAAGLDASFFSKVLAGKRSPPSDEGMLRRIAEVLGLDAVELIVAAGRIPAEWSALWDDAVLFKEVHARASTGGRVTPMGPIACGRRPAGPRRPPEPQTEILPHKGLSEELL
ncbi:MAG: helix-turn-helix transcriptional regulator [Elusimicrobia bacterium]|nr:helix-turn-helix transcriptional regulator [Elusimicrobiota bacterium]